MNDTVFPFIALATVASVTTRLRLGTGVCLVPQHHPITLAKAIATAELTDFIVGEGFANAPNSASLRILTSMILPTG